jgi:hypothetical protein
MADGQSFFLLAGDADVLFGEPVEPKSRGAEVYTEGAVLQRRFGGDVAARSRKILPGG